MTPEVFFSAARELKGAPLTQAEVNALNAVVMKWLAPPSENPMGLGDGAAFFDKVRAAFGHLTQQQVQGFETLLQAFGVVRWPLAFAAYGLATAWHETAAQMQPVKEAYWLSEAWRKTNLRYYPWYGRGYVQLTWEANYKRADEELGLGGRLKINPDVALEPGVAARVMIHGMEGGWFTGKGLKDYLPLSGRAGFDAYKEARRIINGVDKWEVIAKEAQAFEGALIAGAWA